MISEQRWSDLKLELSQWCLNLCSPTGLIIPPSNSNEIRAIPANFCYPLLLGSSSKLGEFQSKLLKKRRPMLDYR
jgi:hypothetical protein